MSEKINEFETWESVIKVFLLERRDQKELDLLSKKKPKKSLYDKGQAILVQLFHNLGKDEKLSDEVANVEKRKNSGANKLDPLKFQQKRYMELVELSKNANGIEEITKTYEDKLEEIEKFHEPINWISWAAENAKSVMFATHVAKLTHPSIKKASSFFVPNTRPTGKYLDTSSLRRPIFDDAVDNAAYTPVSSFLKLKVKERTIADHISANDPIPFRWVTNDENLLEEWAHKFSESFKTKNPKSHFLSKQIYFPIGLVSEESNQFEYHLLCNVKSSSLAHAFFNVLSAPYEEPNNSYQKAPFIIFPGKAKIAVTASKKAHANVSPLNIKRDGEFYLLSTQPPSWQRQRKPPLNKRSLFDHFYTSRANEEIKSLRGFLLLFERIDLSIKDPKKKKKIDGWVNQIIEEVMIYATSIQNLPAGWSNTENIRLKLAHQYFLDPYRDDEPFQKARQAADWQTVICADFANWLNGRLKGKDKQFTPQSNHTRMWKKLMEKQLREQAQAIDWDIKYQNREKQA